MALGMIGGRLLGGVLGGGKSGGGLLGGGGLSMLGKLGFMLSPTKMVQASLSMSILKRMGGQ